MTSEALFAAASVLVVDDEPANVALLERLLRRAGVASVYGTTDPIRALALFRELVPDLVFVDLHMPSMDGLELHAAIVEELAADEFVPVVMLTADFTPGTRERALAAGVNDFLSKPFDLTEVVLRAGNLLRTRALHTRVTAELRDRRRNDEAAAALASERRASVTSVLMAGGPRMVFQPIIELATGRILGYEALARFDGDPSRTPDVWFAEAESVGLGEELEVAAVRAALAHLPSLPPDTRIAVNLSPSVAASPVLAEVLAGVDARRVVVEITEHVRVTDYDALLAGIATLRRLGVQVSVDDAGAGYAGLTHILRIEPDYIKLDIALTRGIDTSMVKRALAAALVTFAAELGAVIIAEGIETAAEVEALAAIGIAAGQGYHLGRPADLPVLSDLSSCSASPTGVS